MSSTVDQRRLKRAFIALLLAFFVNFLGYAFIVPILPSWQTQFDLNATQATLLVSLWAVPLLLFGPITGRITDRFGAGRTMFISLVLLTASSGLYVVATNEWVRRSVSPARLRTHGSRRFGCHHHDGRLSGRLSIMARAFW